MLKDRELVGIVAQIIQQLLCETGSNGPTTNSDGSFYRRSLLIAGKLGNEVVAVVDLARQLRELGTVSNKVRTHCNSNVDRRIRIVRCFDQQIYKRQRFIYGVGVMALLETKQFFELVDENQVVDIFVLATLFDCFHQSERAAFQQG